MPATPRVMPPVSFMATYYDAGGRTTATVNVGTYGGSVFSRPANATQNTASDTLLLTTYGYNVAGRLETDHRPCRPHQQDLLRQFGKNHQDHRQLRQRHPLRRRHQTTLYTYDGSNHVLTLTADLPGTDQVTEYVYGFTTDTLIP